jgi:hypothetical protein
LLVIKGRSHQTQVIFNLGLDDVFPLLALSQGYRVIEIQLRANPGLVPIKEKTNLGSMDNLHGL